MAFKDKQRAAEYNKSYKAKWYKENKQRLVERVAERKREIKEWLDEYKKTLKCEKCGFSHPAALDFHHKDGEEKEDNVATLVAYGWSRESLLEEISKCDVLCSNCHRVLHYEERLGSSFNGRTEPLQGSD